MPDLCVIEAAAVVDPDHWPSIELLLTHSQCVRLELPADWRDVAAAARALGTAACAVAMLAAVDTTPTCSPPTLVCTATTFR